MYLAWNRIEYTKASFRTLRENTDWRYVDRLVVYDDGSEDGTAEFLERAGKTFPVPAFDFRQVNFNSPGATMNDYIALTEAEAFVKIDNDIAVPPGWLGPLIKLAQANPEYDLIGAEAGYTGPAENRRARYTVQKARHIGGVGLMRVEAFMRRPPVPASLGQKHRRDGFTIWQYRQHPTSAWITPDLALVQLDRIPEEPWLSLSKEYCAQGWQRDWGPYEFEGRVWWEWMDRCPLDWPDELFAPWEEEVV